MKPRLAWIKGIIMEDGINLQVSTGGDMTLAEMFLLLKVAETQLIDKARGKPTGQLIPGMLTPDLKRVPGLQN